MKKGRTKLDTYIRKYCYIIWYMKRALALAFLTIVLPIYGQEKSVRPNSHAPDTVELKQPAPKTQPAENVAKSKQQGYLSRLLAPENVPNIALCFVGLVGTIVAVRTLKAIERQALSMRRQTTHLRNSVVQARNAARSAKTGTDALIASERAWIDGELVSSRNLGIYRYSLKIRNLGKTPAQIRSYQISVGPLTKGTTFSPEKLSTQKTRNLHIFIGSGEIEALEEMIDMDELFPTDDSTCLEKGAYSVVIKYTDVVTGTPADRTEHETSFVYLYTPFLHSTERLSIYNKYS
jgi:hypothetical protein